MFAIGLRLVSAYHNKLNKAKYKTKYGDLSFPQFAQMVITESEVS